MRLYIFLLKIKFYLGFVNTKLKKIKWLLLHPQMKQLAIYLSLSLTTSNQIILSLHISNPYL